MDDNVLWPALPTPVGTFANINSNGTLLLVQRGETEVRVRLPVREAIVLYRLLQRHRQVLIDAAVREALEGGGQRRGE
jgi:hypothetical protein